MIKKKIIAISALSILFVFLFFRYAGLLVFWLVTPGDGELRPAEKVLFEELKGELKIEDIYRLPNYHISNPRDTTTYMLYIKLKDCNSIDSIVNIKANSIVNRIYNQVNLNPKFIAYDIIFTCNGYDKNGKIYYKHNRFLRDSIRENSHSKNSKAKNLKNSETK
jgi:hypothetical protein